MSDTDSVKSVGGRPPVRVYPRTVVEAVPTHDGAPCFTAWEYDAPSPDAPTDFARRPKFAIPVYDISTPSATAGTGTGTEGEGEGEEEGEARGGNDPRALARHLFESTLDARRSLGGGGDDAPDRIDVLALPLPLRGEVEVEVEGVVAACIAHLEAERAARAAEFYIPALFDPGAYRRAVVVVVVVVDRLRERWGEGGEVGGGGGGGSGAFLRVKWDLAPEWRARDPGAEERVVDRYGGGEGGMEGVGEMLAGFRRRIRWFYDTYVMEGMLERELRARGEA